EHQISPSPATKHGSTETSNAKMAGISSLQMNTSIDSTTTSQTLTFQTSYPLVGRSNELLTLTQVYGGIHTVGHLLLLEGEAGIGKTRLAEEFLANVQCKGELSGIVFFDDIQWADSATLDLLNYLVRRLREQSVCLLVTLRSRQASNDNRLHQLKNEALRAGNATVVSLSRLNLLSVREL